MPYDPKAIANYFLDAAQAKGESLTPLQVIKLTFCAHGWYLGLTEKPLSFEPPQAWKYGPVFPSLYAAFRDYGDGPINGRAMAYMDYEVADVPPPTREAHPEVCNFLDQIFTQYGTFSGSQLSTITHRKGSPWDYAWNDLKGCYKRNFVIPEEKIIEYYKGLSQQNAKSRADQ